MQRLTLDLNRKIDEVAFVVSHPSDWLVLTFDWEETMTWGEVWLIDPAGRLRFTYMDVHRSRIVVIHRETSLNSYTAVPGMVDEGEWKIRLIRHIPQRIVLEWQYGIGELPDLSLLEQEERDYWTTGVGTDNGKHTLDQYDWEQCLEGESRWYKGDCHAHTTLSDGKMTPWILMQQAERRELDYFFATDHNTLPSSWPTGEVLVIPAMEFTSFGRGDWNALGMKEWIDCFNEVHGGLRTDEGQQLLLEEASKQGAFRVINHPIAGRFSWRYLRTSLESVDGIEIWNSPYERKSIVSNERALMLWSALWNEGYRIVGLGGSDIHCLPEDISEEHDIPPTVGDPATYVYADQLSPTAILTAIRAGHTYVSRGPELTVSYTVEGNEQIFIFGDDLTDALQQSPMGAVHCTLHIRSAAGGIVRCIVNGAEVSAERITADNQQFEFRFDWQSAPYMWSRFEVRTESNQLLAVSNPVYYGSKTPTVRTWQELLQQVGFTLP